MATALLMMRHSTQAWLVPCDATGRDTIISLPRNGEFLVKITQPRNSKHHRKFFALMNEVFQNQKTFATLEHLLDAIKIAVGHCDERMSVTGTVFYVPRSISFSSMDQQQFTQFYDAAVNVILRHILPNTDREDLEERIYQILGEAGPSALR